MYCFSLVNVVWYDGSDAYVSKFVLPTENHEVTKDGVARVSKYLSGNGELLKLDVLYPITFENLVAFKDSDNDELKACFERYASMYFVV